MALNVTKKADATKAKTTTAAKTATIVEVYLAHGTKHRAGGFLFEKGIVYQVPENVANYLFNIVISNEQKFEQAGIKQKGLVRKVATVSLGAGADTGITVPDDEEITAHVAKAHTGEADEQNQGDGTGDGQDGDGQDGEGVVSV